MKSAKSQLPVLEGLEPRVLLSGGGMETGIAALLGRVGGMGRGLPESIHAAAIPGWNARMGALERLLGPRQGMVFGAALPKAGTTTAPKIAIAAAPKVAVAPPPTPTAGSRVTGVVFTQNGLQQLLVNGTNGSDVITLSAITGGVTVSWGSGSQNCMGTFSQILLYAFAGSDTIRLTNTVTAPTAIIAGDGNDTVYDAGKGADTIYGGNGDDLLISIGGGGDRVYGEAGTDSFWVDGSDTVADASAAETAAGNVHRVTQFYQPTRLPAVSLEIAGQNFTDPSLTAYAKGYTNFSSQPLFTAAPTYNDIRQGALGDCYYVASLAAIADTNPNAIGQMMTALGDGTYAVRFFRNGQPVYVRVDGDLPVYSGTSLAYEKMSPTGEIWAPIAEKAYAYFRTGANSYGSIEGGWMADVCTQVTNRPTQTMYTTATDPQLYNFMSGAIAGGRAATLGSRSNASGPIVGSHAYMVKSVQTVSGQMLVTVYNPWGVDGRTYDSNPNDGLLVLTMAQVRQYFTAGVAIA